jgi:penicillin-binding protein 1A
VQNGRPASYLVDDSPITEKQLTGDDWVPQNYDLKFMGPMPLRRALYLSRNLATIRLGQELGENSVVEMAKKFGLTTKIPPYPSIHIGSADVFPIEMVAAYTAFPTLGVRATPHAILRVENARGDVLWQPNTVKVQVMSPEEAWLMVDMMKDVIQHGTAYGAVWGAGFRIPAGGKTGTTNDGTDVWFIGFTADLVAGLWMGLDKPQKIKSNAQGGVLAGPAWTSFMTEVYQRRAQPPDWPRPEGMLAQTIDRSTGLLRNPFCPTEVVITEFYIPGTEPLRECDVHTPFGMMVDSLGNPISVPAESGAAGMRVTPGGMGIIRPSGPPRPPPQRDTSNPFRLPPR